MKNEDKKKSCNKCYKTFVGVADLTQTSRTIYIYCYFVNPIKECSPNCTLYYKRTIKAYNLIVLIL